MVRQTLVERAATACRRGLRGLMMSATRDVGHPDVGLAIFDCEEQLSRTAAKSLRMDTRGGAVDRTSSRGRPPAVDTAQKEARPSASWLLKYSVRASSAATTLSTSGSAESCVGSARRCLGGGLRPVGGPRSLRPPLEHTGFRRRRRSRLRKTPNRCGEFRGVCRPSCFSTIKPESSGYRLREASPQRRPAARRLVDRTRVGREA
jgi:hypothetical protein